MLVGMLLVVQTFTA